MTDPIADRPRPRLDGRRRVHSLTIPTVLVGLFIVYGTTIPFEFSGGAGSIVDAWRLALTSRGVRGAYSKTDFAANILLFLPWGGLLSARFGRAGWGPIASVGVATLLGTLLSAFVETVQVFAPSRVTSAVDLVSNTLGSAIGGLLGWAAAQWAWPWAKPLLRSGVRSRPMAVLAILGASCWWLVDLAPYIPSLDVGDLKQAVKAARPIPFGPPIRGDAPEITPADRLIEGCRWAVIALAVALAIREAGRRGAVLVVAAVVLVASISAGVELSQLVFWGHISDATSVAVAAVAALAAGTAVAAGPMRPPRGWIVPALWVWGGAIVLDQASPLDAFGGFELPGAGRLVPFLGYFRTSPPSALATAVEKVAVFVPIGLLSAARSRRWTPGRAILLGLACGAALEAIQLFNAERHADVSDAILAAAGAWVGCRLWRRAERLEGHRQAGVARKGRIR